ncbi:hypothetical protein [Paraburkholderia sp. CNPSo 3274]|nr:hypothetical protein [Paraburkholderia sp. CNPSo 3274]
MRTTLLGCAPAWDTARHRLREGARRAGRPGARSRYYASCLNIAA